AHNESTSNFKDLSNLEFGESIHGLESDELIYDLEFNRPTYDSVVVVQENKDVRLDCSKEKLYEEMVFKSWEEAFDTLKLYSQYEGFKLKKGWVKKTSNGTIQKRSMLCEHSGEYKSKNMQLTKETSTKYIKCPCELTQETYDRVEFYVNTVKLKLLQIQRALRKEFSDHEVYLSEIHKATTKYYSRKRKDMLNNAASLYKELVRRKNEDPRWYVAIEWNRESHSLQKLF
ncbi:211_t:CDS:2, partial [Racocetra persica]